MNPKSQQLFEEKLVKNERILWCDQPDSSVRVGKQGIFLFPLIILASSMILYDIFETIKSEDPILNIVASIPLIIISFYIFFIYFIYGKKIKENIHYAVTNKRILVLHKNNLLEIYLDKISAISKTIGKNGIGTIRFSNNTDIFSSVYSTAAISSLNLVNAPIFYEIKEAQTVYEIIEKAKQEYRA